jgi:ribosomal protein L37E
LRNRRVVKDDRLVRVVRCTIDARDKGLRKLLKEYNTYKDEFIPQIQEAVYGLVTDREIKVYAQQKWLAEERLLEYVDRLPLHPMVLRNQSVSLRIENNLFILHLHTGARDGGADCLLVVPPKYREMMMDAAGANNPSLGQVELIQDNRFGRFNAHIQLKLPRPRPYEPEGWVGVDVGWNHLAVSALVTPTKRGDVTFHHDEYKSRVIQLKYLYKEAQRSGKVGEKWRHRLANVTSNIVGIVAKEVVEKAKRNRAGVSMEDLSFGASTKRWLIPRYKLQMAVKNLCEMEGVPFTKVAARNTSFTCSRCGHVDKRSRDASTFKCVACGYSVNADLNAAFNIAAKATNPVGYMPSGKDLGAICSGERRICNAQGSQEGVSNKNQ